MSEGLKIDPALPATIAKVKASKDCCAMGCVWTSESLMFIVKGHIDPNDSTMMSTEIGIDDWGKFIALVQNKIIEREKALRNVGVN